MKFKWYGIIINLILAALAISGAAFYRFNTSAGIKKNPVIQISDADSGKIYGKWPLVKTGELLPAEFSFSIEFIHSVNQSPVREKFKVEGKTIRPCEVRFYSFGAGMQSDLAQGQTMSREADALVISGTYPPVTEFNYIVGTVSDHLLLINDSTVSLRELCGRNAHISIRVK